MPKLAPTTPMPAEASMSGRVARAACALIA
jgi:hypothetical protein